MARLPGDYSQVGWLPPSSLKIPLLREPVGLSTFRGDDQVHGFGCPANLRSACTKAGSLSRPHLRRSITNRDACSPVRLNLPARLNWLETALFDPPWGALNSQIRPSVSAGGVLHSRAVGIDVEVHLCSCFREAQHCGHFVCSLGGFLDAAAGMDTKPAPVRGSGSPRLPGSSPRVRGKRQVRHQGIIVARLIPACAAKTRTGCAPARASRAHPRACGENPGG